MSFPSEKNTEEQLKATSFPLIMKESVLYVDQHRFQRVEQAVGNICSGGGHQQGHGTRAATVSLTAHCSFGLCSCSNSLCAETIRVIILALENGANCTRPLTLPFSAPLRGCCRCLGRRERGAGFIASMAMASFGDFSCTSDIRSFMNIHNIYR